MDKPIYQNPTRMIEALTALIKYVEADQFYRGICYHIECLWFTERPLLSHNEYSKFYNWFQTQKPNNDINAELHLEFTKHSSFYGGHWWWFKNEDGKKQRILFLKHLKKIFEEKLAQEKK